MKCYNCGNCKTGEYPYFCLMKNDFVFNEKDVVEKVRSGWKKGNKDYEMHRMNSRKKVEIADDNC